MTNAAVNINNLTTTNLSLDIQIADGKNIRNLLKPLGQVGASVDVGDICSLSDLNENAEIQRLLGVPGVTAAKISITVVRGTTDVRGADVGVVIDSSGMADARPFVRVSWLAGAGGARDIPVYVANFPFAARVLDSQLMVSTAVAGTAQLRDAAAGAGNTLSAANATTAAGRVRDPGTGQTGGSGVLPTLARNASLYVRLTAGDSAGSYIIEFERTS